MCLLVAVAANGWFSASELWCVLRFADDYDCRVNATNASQCAWAANQTVGGNPPFIGPACTWDPKQSACGGGEPSKYRCRLGCILLKMTAISLLTGPPQKKGKGGGGAWSQVANCKVQGWNTSVSPGYSAELRKLGTLDHLDHLILGRNNAISHRRNSASILTDRAPDTCKCPCFCYRERAVLGQL